MNAINTVDAIVITVIALSAIIALFRGFVREVLSLAAMILATAITIAFIDELAGVMSQRFESTIVAYGLSGVILFIGSLIGLGVVNHFIVRAVKESEFKAFDRSLGLMFGLLRGAFVVSLAFLTATILLEENDYPDWLREAKTLGAMKMGAQVLESVAPEYTQQLRDVGTQSKAQAEKKGESLDKLRKTLETPGQTPLAPPQKAL